MSDNNLLDLPLAGTRILAFEQFGAGPFATLQLADLGADVIKVEDPTVGGDVGRRIPPYRAGDTSLFFESLNRGKRSIALDLRDAEGRATFHRLVPSVDAVFNNLRGDKPESLGLRYQDLRHLNERIVCCSLSGFGQTGPRASTGAYDYVLQGLAGWMSLTGEPGSPPAKSGLSLVDFSTGLTASLALMAGIFHARETGLGCDCDISLFESALALLTYVGTWAASRDDYEAPRLRHSAHPSIVPFQAIPVADGWIVVACAKEKFWRALCTAIERTDLSEDDRFGDFAGRLAHRTELQEELYKTFRSKPGAEWIELLDRVGVPCGPINTVREALADPQVAARGAVRELDHPELGKVAHVVSPLRLSTGVRPLEFAPAKPGVDTEAVIAELTQLVSQVQDG